MAARREAACELGTEGSPGEKVAGGMPGSAQQTEQPQVQEVLTCSRSPEEGTCMTRNTVGSEWVGPACTSRQGSGRLMWVA